MFTKLIKDVLVQLREKPQASHERLLKSVFFIQHLAHALQKQIHSKNKAIILGLKIEETLNFSERSCKLFSSLKIFYFQPLNLKVVIYSLNVAKIVLNSKFRFARLCAGSSCINNHKQLKGFSKLVFFKILLSQDIFIAESEAIIFYIYFTIKNF